MKPLVFDSTVLSSFARSGLLGLLEKLTSGYDRVVPTPVLQELRNGISPHPGLATVDECAWLREVRVDGLVELISFSEFHQRLGAGERNVGESSVLAWAQRHEGVALTDDQSAAQLAKEKRIEVRRTPATPQEIARGA